MAQEKQSAIWKDELNNSANCLPLSHCIQDKNRINNQHTGLSEYVYSIKNNLGIGLSNQNRSTIIHIFIFNSLLASGNLIWVQTVCKAYQQKVSPDLDPNHLTLWFELDLFFYDPSVKFEWNCWIPSKVIDRKPQFSQNLKHNSVKMLWIIPLFELDLWPFCKV